MLLEISGRNCFETVDLACIQFMQCRDSFNEVDKILGFMCVRRSTDDEVENTFEGWTGSKREKDLRSDNVLESNCLTVSREQ